VIVDEVLHHVVLYLVFGEWWQFWVNDEVLEVAELGFKFLDVTMNVLLVLLNLHVLFVVTLQEWVHSLNKLTVE